MADAAAPSMPETPAFERVPAAEGSLLRGWLAVAYPFRKEEKARRTIAAWAGATTNARIVWSLIVAAAIDVCSGYLGAAFTATKGRLSVHVPGLAGVGSGVNGVLLHLTEFFAIAAVAAAFVRLLRYGRFQASFMRMLRPWALVQPIIAVTGVLLALISLPELAHVGIINTPIWGYTFNIPSDIVVVTLFYVAGLTQNALTVGAYRFRYDQVLVLLACITWVATYFSFNALTNLLQHVL